MTQLQSGSEILGAGELVDIRVMEFSAAIREMPREDLESDDVAQNLEVAIGSGSNTIEVRVKAHVETREAEYSATVAMQYRFESDSEPTEEAVREFAERAGIAGVYPYLRELVQSSSMRLKQDAVTMPFLRLGAVPLDANGELE